MRGAILAAAAVLAGCAAPAAEPATDAAPPAPDPGEDARPAADAPPELTIGRAWTYRAAGEWDAESEFTVVVAERSGAGHLFAGEREADLATQVAWGRPFFGWRDAELNVVNGDETPDVDRLFEFPLEDGASWSSNMGRVVARAAEVATPDGPRPGFVMTVGAATASATWEYAADVGFLTRFRLERDGRVLIDATLVEVGERDAWVWYERGEVVLVEGPRAAALDVPAGAHAVVGNAGGAGRAAVAITPAGAAAPWTWRAGEAYGNVAVVLPAAPGVWTVAAGGTPDAYAYARVAPVTWIRSG